MTTAGASIGDPLHGPNNRRQKWLLIGMLLALIGLGISAYSTVHHLEVMAKGATDAGCNINDTINCDTVARSEYSEVMGIPLGVWGGAYFAALLVLLGIVAFTGKGKEENTQAYAAMVGIGVIVSVVLGGISALKLGSACLTCIGIYVVTLIQAGVLVVYRNEIAGQFHFGRVIAGGTTATIVVAVTVLGFSLLVPRAEKAGDSTKTAAINSVDSATTGPRSGNQFPNLSPTTNEIPVTKSAFGGLGEDYRYGNDNAKVTVVEFADFQCPACARMGMVLGSLKATMGDRVLFVFRNYPLDSKCNSGGGGHEHSCEIATMARCAGQYGKFWEYHDLAFQNQRSAGAGVAAQWGARVGLTPDQIATCQKSPDILAKIKDDASVGNSAGVNSTPTLFINGRRYVGTPSADAIRVEIETVLASLGSH